MQLRDEDPLHSRLRKILGLNPTAPDPDGLVWEEEGPVPLYGEEREREWHRWHAEDFRADLARSLARFFRPMDIWRRIRSWINCHRSRRLLARAPWIRFEATHNPSPEELWAIEGDLRFPGGSIPFHFISAEGLAEHVRSESEQQEEYVLCEENDLLFENRWIVLPGKEVSADDAKEALARWYHQLHIRHRRHPVSRGKEPRVEVII